MYDSKYLQKLILLQNKLISVPLSLYTDIDIRNFFSLKLIKEDFFNRFHFPKFLQKKSFQMCNAWKI